MLGIIKCPSVWCPQFRISRIHTPDTVRLPPYNRVGGKPFPGFLKTLGTQVSIITNWAFPPFTPTSSWWVRRGRVFRLRCICPSTTPPVWFSLSPLSFDRVLIDWQFCIWDLCEMYRTKSLWPAGHLSGTKWMRWCLQNKTHWSRWAKFWQVTRTHAVLAGWMNQLFFADTVKLSRKSKSPQDLKLIKVLERMRCIFSRFEE